MRSILVLLGLLFFYSASSAETTDFEKYIHAQDDSFTWKVIHTNSTPGMTTYIIDMTSQTWRTTDDVNRTQWQHWLKVAVPDEVKSTVGFVMIGGGSNGRQPPTSANPELVEMARLTNTVVAELSMIPNQPLIFHGDGEQRVEDNLIGYTWNQFLKTKDQTWLARAPMTKSVVRAMDCLTAFMASDAGGHRKVDRFTVAGGSKRGWTTWITAAMDKRVVAIVPIVIDVLNSRPSMQHHFAAYGYWAPAIGDYVRHRVTQRMDKPEYEEITRLVDPLSYKDRLTMPKLILNAAGDQFFLPDSSQFYWDQLQGPKALRYVPNTDHGMGNSDALQSLIAFYWLIVNEKEVPTVTWSVDGDQMAVQTSVPAASVVHWQATNPVARDFRKETFGANFTNQPLQANANGVYAVSLESPPEGWTASFAEASFDVGAPFPLKLTTEVRVVPDVLPFAAKDSSLEASLTVTCEAKDGRAAAEMIAALNALFNTGALKAPHFSTQQIGRRIYVNWQPPLHEFEHAAAGLTKLLSDKGCSRFAYQLESGLGATIPPGLETVASP